MVILSLSSGAAAQNVSYVRMANMTSFGDPSYIGLFFVKFEGSAVGVPEPGTLALLAAGLAGLLCYAWRKRR